MGPRSLIREAWEMIPILLLLMAGAMIALKSGVRRSGKSQNLRQVAGNLSQITLRVLGYVALLLALQYWIGLRPQLGW
jgi:CHASE2 domain-containing sensor protein